MAAAGKVQTCHHLLQMSEVAIHVRMCCSPVDAQQRFTDEISSDSQPLANYHHSLVSILFDL